MASYCAKLFVLFVVIGATVTDCYARSINIVESKVAKKSPLDKLLILQRKETSPANFTRLVAMRLIYGVASLMGLQDRIGGVLNGAFVPPGVDDDYAFDLDDDDDDIEDLFDE